MQLSDRFGRAPCMWRRPLIYGWWLSNQDGMLLANILHRLGWPLLKFFSYDGVLVLPYVVVLTIQRMQFILL